MNPAIKALARCNFLAFVKATFPEYQIGWVHREIAARLELFLADVIEKKSPRLILTMPPRHGKSQLVSRHFPAWCLGVRPSMNMIFACHSDPFAKRINRDVQRIIESDDFKAIFPSVSLEKVKGVTTSKTMDFFELPKHGGSFRSAGVNSGITGMGCEILNIDDPFKDRKSADSPTMRERIWDWYASTARTRLAPGGGVIVTVTRWHQDDLVGRLLDKEKEGAEKWHVINYPAIAEKDERYRKTGEALHPERFPVPLLDMTRRTIGEYEWASLYQQHPTPRSGGLFKKSWVNYYTEKPKVFDRVIQSWDLTFKDSNAGDFCAGFVLGQVGADIFVLDLIHEKIDFVGQIKAIVRLTNRWPEATAKIVEDKANGPAIISALKNKVPGIIPFNPQGGKEARANSAAPIVEAGNLYLPKNAPWLREFEDEFFNFPGSVHDDMVDALDQGIIYLTQKQSRGIASFL